MWEPIWASRFRYWLLTGDVSRCDAPRPLRQVSSSYSLSLPCHLLACCILSCHHVHCIIMFSKLASVRVSQFRPLSVLSPDTLACAHGMSVILFYKWPENILGMGWKLACGVVIFPTDVRSNHENFGRNLYHMFVPPYFASQILCFLFCFVVFELLQCQVLTPYLILSGVLKFLCGY